MRRSLPAGRRVAAGLLACALAGLLAACEPADPLQSTRLLVFGTVVDVATWGTAPKPAQAAFDELRTAFEGWHREWHAWEDSPLSRANRAFAAGAGAELTPDLLRLAADARTWSRASGGLFDPAIGRLVALWGFNEGERPDGPPPAPAAIAELVNAHPAMDDLTLDGASVRSRNPQVWLDFGGIAKGYAVDRAIERLRARGVQNAIVNAGGNLRAIGTKDGQPWRIGIRDPRGPGVIASLTITGDESVSTSGDYERRFEWQGVRYHHILDPRSGYPAIGTIAVTVVAENAEKADVASTALMIAGPTEWRAVARALGVAQALRIDESGHVELTPALAARLHWEVDPPPPVMVVPEP